MKRTKKQAFTVVELIIVIAVIGILAAILIPAFSNVIEKANQKSALASAKNTLSTFLAEKYNDTDNQLPEEIVFIVEKANKFYVYGWSSLIATDNNLLTPYGNNGEGYAFDSLEALIDSVGCTQEEFYNGIVDFQACLQAKKIPNYSLFGSTSEGKPNAFYLPSRKAVDLTKYFKLSSSLVNTPDNVKIFIGTIIPNVSDRIITFPEGYCGIYFFGGFMNSGLVRNPVKKVDNLPSPDSVTSGGDYVVPATIPVSYDDENMFTGYSGSDGGWYNPGDTIFNVTQDLILTANWTIEEYNMSFQTTDSFCQLNHGYVCDFGAFMNNTNVRPADMDALIRSITVTYEGEGDAEYEFLGWRLADEDDDGTIYNANYVGTMIFHKNVVFYAAFNDTVSNVLLGMRDINASQVYYDAGIFYEGSTLELGTPAEMAEYIKNKMGFDTGYVQATDCTFTGWRCEIYSEVFGEPEWTFYRAYSIGDIFTVPHALTPSAQIRLIATYTLNP